MESSQIPKSSISAAKNMKGNSSSYTASKLSCNDASARYSRIAALNRVDLLIKYTNSEYMSSTTRAAQTKRFKPIELDPYQAFSKGVSTCTTALLVVMRCNRINPYQRNETTDYLTSGPGTGFLDRRKFEGDPLARKPIASVPDFNPSPRWARPEWNGNASALEIVKHCHTR